MKIKYLKENFEPIIISSKNLTEVLIKLGLDIKGNSRSTIKKYIKLYNLDISHFETRSELYKRTLINYVNKLAIPLENILVSGSTYSSTSLLKEKLYDAGLKERRCELCGQGEIWKGSHMSLILDHINGINNDNSWENLRIVCPNCNATLPTHCRGANKINRINEKCKLIKKQKTINIQKRVFALRKTIRPLYVDLVNDIKLFGYSATGRKYNVSDNAIRKWIKYYEKHLN